MNQIYVIVHLVSQTGPSCLLNLIKDSCFELVDRHLDFTDAGMNLLGEVVKIHYLYFGSFLKE